MENIGAPVNTKSAKPTGRPPRWLDHLELPLVLFAAWLALISIPIHIGHIGLSWDGLNHHIYLGWVAEKNRFEQDYMAASLQAYQFPYLYWPAYKLAISGFDGRTAGVLLATMHLINVPPVWLMARTLMPEKTWFGLSLRFSAVALAFMSAVPLKILEATGNDLLAAAPFLWALAIGLAGTATTNPVRRRIGTLRALAVGLLGGVAIASKLSNGPLALLLPMVFLFYDSPPRDRISWAAICAASIVTGFALSYGYWGYQLWFHFGNPFFPFYDSYFEHLRAAAGWRR